MRRPSPVITKPLEIKKAMTISQMMLLPNPCTADLISATPVNAIKVIPNMNTDPICIGCVIQAIIVDTKIANIYQACMLNDSGLRGVSAQISIPMTRGRMNLRYLIEFCILNFPSFYTDYSLQLSIYPYKKVL